MGFSLSQFLLWISEDSVAAQCWISESLKSITAEMYPDVSNGWATWVACWDGEMSGYTEGRRADDDRIKVQRKREERCRCVCAHALMCTFLYVNHILLISVGGNFHFPYVTIIHSDPHLLSCCSPPPQWSFFSFIFIVIDSQQWCVWLMGVRYLANMLILNKVNNLKVFCRPDRGQTTINSFYKTVQQ